MTALAASEINLDWDRHNKKQIEEAKVIYRQARSEGRTITDIAGAIVDCFLPDLESIVIKEKTIGVDEFSIRVLDESGDRVITWNSKSAKQIKEAAKMFADYLKKGYRIYSVDDKGKRTRRIYAFDESLEEVVVDETKTKERLKDFVSSFKRLVALPKTMPG